MTSKGGIRRPCGRVIGGGARLALAGLAMLGAMAAGGTVRAGDGGRQDAGFYASARGGFNWATDQRWLGQRNGFLARDDKKSGWAAGGAFGYDFVPFRIELEYLHRDNGLSSLNVRNDGGLGLAGTGPRALARGSTKATGVMTNGIVELNRDGTLRPWFGLGLGFVEVDGSAFLAAGGRRILAGDDIVVGAQALAGLALRLGRRLSAEVGYRYLVTDKAQLGLGERHLQRQRYKSHGLLFGLTWRFGGAGTKAKKAAATTPAPAPEPAPAAPAPVNHPPQAFDDHVVAIAGQAVEIRPLANDRDPDRSALDLVSVTDPAHGALQRTGGRLVYRSAPDFRGTERLTYRVSDGHGGEDAATIVIEVTAPEVGPYLVFFDFDSAKVRTDALPILDKAAADFRKYGFARIELVGHADRAGPDWYNDRLSLRRAESVKKAMIARGVPADAIVTQGRGEREPLVPTGDGVREPQNRRVEIGLHD